MGVVHSMDDDQVGRISDALRNSADAIQGINNMFDVIDGHMSHLQQFNTKLNTKVEGTLAAMSRLDATFNNRAEVMIDTVFTLSDELASALENVISTLRAFDLRREASQLPKVVIPLAVPMLLLLVELAVANAYLGILVASLPEVRSKYSSYLLGNASAVLLGLMLSLVWLACYRIWLSRRSRRPRGVRNKVLGMSGLGADAEEAEPGQGSEILSEHLMGDQPSVSSRPSGRSAGSSLTNLTAPVATEPRRSRREASLQTSSLNSVPVAELEAELQRRRTLSGLTSADSSNSGSEHGRLDRGDPTRSSQHPPGDQLGALHISRQARRREINQLRAELGMASAEIISESPPGFSRQPSGGLATSSSNTPRRPRRPSWGDTASSSAAQGIAATVLQPRVRRQLVHDQAEAGSPGVAEGDLVGISIAPEPLSPASGLILPAILRGDREERSAVSAPRTPPSRSASWAASPRQPSGSRVSFFGVPDEPRTPGGSRAAAVAAVSLAAGLGPGSGTRGHSSPPKLLRSSSPPQGRDAGVADGAASTAISSAPSATRSTQVSAGTSGRTPSSDVEQPPRTRQRGRGGGPAIRSMQNPFAVQVLWSGRGS